MGYHSSPDVTIPPVPGADLDRDVGRDRYAADSGDERERPVADHTRADRLSQLRESHAASVVVKAPRLLCALKK